MGGTSGALYSIFFSALAHSLQSTQDKTTITIDTWVIGLRFALERLYTYTRARPPSRTLVDPLAAFVEAVSTGGLDIKQAISSASDAAERTKELEAKAGRSAYVDGDRLREERVADPGAWGVKIILDSLLSNLD
jgi:dihydroxyacetone kinase